MAHTVPKYQDPGPPYFRFCHLLFPKQTYQLPVLLAPTFLNQKTKMGIGAVSAHCHQLGAEPHPLTPRA